MTVEETRAAAYRASVRQRKVAVAWREGLLRGSPVAVARVRAAWQPLIDYIRERSSRD